ncbi:4210_t:CDS:2, partial [Ambispora leptoticha]
IPSSDPDPIGNLHSGQNHYLRDRCPHPLPATDPIICDPNLPEWLLLLTHSPGILPPFTSPILSLLEYSLVASRATSILSYLQLVCPGYKALGSRPNCGLWSVILPILVFDIFYQFLVYKPDLYNCTTSP